MKSTCRVTGVTRALIWRVFTHIFMFCQQISSEIDWTSKETSQAEHEYVNKNPSQLTF